MDVVVVIAQYQPALLTLLQLEMRCGDRLLHHPVERLGAGEREDLVGTVGSEESGAEQLEPGGAGPVFEPGHEHHVHRGPSPGAAQPPMDLGMRSRGTPVLGNRHEVGDGDGAVVRLEGGLEDIGPRQVALGGGPPALGMDRPGPAPLRIEQRGEHTAAIKTGETAPVDGAVQANQSGRPHVADHSVVGDRLLLANGAGAPAGGFGRRLGLDVGHRHKYKVYDRHLASPATVVHLPAPSPTNMRAFTLLLALALAACRAGGRPTTAPAPREDDAALTQQLTAQLDRAASDWNRGDLDGFVSDYARESTTTFVDGRRARHGFDFIRENYAPRFAPNARRDSLHFEEVEVRRLSPMLALVTARYILERSGTTTASGPFTLVMEQRPEGWRILHDHSSSDPR